MGHSIEAEVRKTRKSAFNPRERIKLGSLLADVSRQAKLTEDEFAAFGQLRDKMPADNGLFSAKGLRPLLHPEQK